MSVWLFIVLATAFGGALLVWQAVSKTKNVSEEMLNRYRDMLTDAREKKAKEISESAEEDSEEGDGE